MLIMHQELVYSDEKQPQRGSYHGVASNNRSEPALLIKLAKVPIWNIQIVLGMLVFCFDGLKESLRGNLGAIFVI